MQNELFTSKNHEPLAFRMRPKSLEDYEGQEHILAKGKMLRRSIEADMVSSIVLYGPPGCHAKGTEILMFDGTTKPVESIQIGDKLMGPDSKPRKVLELAYGTEPLVEIKPRQKWEPFIVNTNHILSLKFSGAGSFHPDTPINISIPDLLRATQVTQERLKLWSTGIEFAEKKIPMDPYAFGYWLGNGSSHTSSVTIRDEHKNAFAYWETLAKKKGCHRKSYRRGASKCQTHAYHTQRGKINPLLEDIRATGALKNKHIPQSYKCNSRKIRLRLLAGLLDSDGHKTKTGPSFQISFKIKRLAEETTFLARSLGIAATLKPRNASWIYKGIKKTGSYWTIYLTPTTKAAKELKNYLLEKTSTFPKQKNPLKTGFEIKNKGAGEYFGFALNGDHLYLTGDFLVHHNTGKTSLARIIAAHTKSEFAELNATDSNVAEIRKAVETAKDALAIGKKTILFIDEIHRFNKGQQDSLLPHVENGTLRLIGATTQNPFFSINSPLVSRSQIFQLRELDEAAIIRILERAIRQELPEVVAEPAALKLLAQRSDGDARRALNGLELAYKTGEPSAGKILISAEDAAESIQKKTLVYDNDGDGHYDTISAFIKSLRGSDPDAALYWLAKMIEAGEEPRYIARRLVVHAAEDVGLADPSALQTATAAQSAVETIGMPEARIPLAMATLHIAMAPKSNSACVGIDAAIAHVAANPLQSIPYHLRDSHYEGAASLGNGEGYKYPHDFPNGFVQQTYLPDPVQLYFPSNRGVERELNERLELIKNLAKK